MPKVKVSALTERGFYRLGKKFTREAQEIEVTDKELKILQAEPKLVVMVMPEEEKKEEKKKDK